jgi:hypothetical protein
MRYDDERGKRRAPGRWEPAEDGEGRRWHGDGEERHGGRGRSRSRPHFAGPFGGPGFPGGPGFVPGRELHGFGPWGRERGMRGPRARRGDVRAAALALLAEQPMNGYQIIQEIG